MMARNSRMVVCLSLAIFLLTVLAPVSLDARQEESAQESQTVEKKAAEGIQAAEQDIAEKSQPAEPKAETTGQSEENEAAETIVPAPKNQKEAIGIYVFLIWIWLSIFVLIYVLRLKVKESDRIYQLKFFDK